VPIPPLMRVDFHRRDAIKHNVPWHWYSLFVFVRRDVPQSAIYQRRDDRDVVIHGPDFFPVVITDEE
jgi:hypothetical protein